MANRTPAVFAAAALLLLLGCEEKKPQPPLSAPKQAPGPVATPQPPAHAPAPAAAPAAAPTPTATPTTDATVSALGASVTLPAGWKRQPPANQMRLAEAVVSDASGEPAKACLVVFSTAGGTVDDNIARWAGQVRDTAGQPAKAKTETRTVNGLKVTIVEINGAFAGMGDTAPKDNWSLRGGIIEAPEGLLFIKMTGPAEAMGHAAEGFTALVNSARKP